MSRWYATDKSFQKWFHFDYLSILKYLQYSFTSKQQTVPLIRIFYSQSVLIFGDLNIL